MYYGFKTPLNQVASVSVPEPRMLMIKAYEKSTLKVHLELIAGIESVTSTLPSIEFYPNETRTQFTGNPYISCVFCYPQI